MNKCYLLLAVLALGVAGCQFLEENPQVQDRLSDGLASTDWSNPTSAAWGAAAALIGTGTTALGIYMRKRGKQRQYEELVNAAVEGTKRAQEPPPNP